VLLGAVGGEWGEASVGGARAASWRSRARPRAWGPSHRGVRGELGRGEGEARGGATCAGTASRFGAVAGTRGWRARRVEDGVTGRSRASGGAAQRAGRGGDWVVRDSVRGGACGERLARRTVRVAAAERVVRAGG